MQKNQREELLDMKKKTNFHIVFTGPALTDGDTCVSALAYSLAATSDLIKTTNRKFNGDNVDIQINIKAGFKHGSFGIELTTFQSFIEGLLNLALSNKTVASATLLSILGLNAKDTIKSLLAFIKNIRNRKINESTTNGDTVIVGLNDGEALYTTTKVYALYEDIKIRQYLELAIVTPLDLEGIETFACGAPDKLFTINKSEKEFFRAPKTEDELLEDETITTHVYPLNISFQETNKWRLTDGTTKFYAEILDNSFLEKIKMNEIAFRKDDSLRVKLKKVRKLTGKGNITEYSIIKVLEHSTGRDLPTLVEEKQLKLFDKYPPCQCGL